MLYSGVKTIWIRGAKSCACTNYHLAGVSQRKEWKSWILFMLEAVEKLKI